MVHRPFAREGAERLYSVLSLVFGVLGGGLLVYGISLARPARASRLWPTAAGRITWVNVARSWIGRGFVYYPQVRYAYSVDDALLEGTRIGFASTLPRFSQGATIYALQHSYPRGKSVTVLYNPSDPRDSVLEPGIRAGLRTILGMAVLLIVMAIAAAVAARMLETVPT